MKAIKCDKCNRYQENSADVVFKHNGRSVKVVIAGVDAIDLCSKCKVELAALVEEWLHSEE